MLSKLKKKGILTLMKHVADEHENASEPNHYHTA